MDQNRESGGMVSLPSDEFEALLERAAETGARRALHEVGLDGADAAEDIRMRPKTSAISAHCCPAFGLRSRQQFRPLCG